MTAPSHARQPDDQQAPAPGGPGSGREWGSASAATLADAAGVLHDILALTAPIADAASRDEGDDALELLERRNPHIDRLAALSPALDRVRDEWAVRAESLAPEVRAAVDAGLRRLASLRAEVAQAEDRAAAALAARRDALASQLAEARASRHASRAYGVSVGSGAADDAGPRYQDRQG